MTTRELNAPESAVDNEYEALRLLVDRSHRHGAYLCLNYRRRDAGVGTVRLRDLYKGPRIVVQHMGGYADMEVRAERVTYVTERVVSALIADGWVRGTPHWGYTDEHELHVSEYGERAHAEHARVAGDAIEALAKFVRT